MNFAVPEELGGPGLGALDTCLVLEELNYGCAGITNSVAANGLATHPLLIAGSEEQRKRYLRQLVNECSLAAYCITEPGAGSDVAGMSTTYRRVGDELVLNGTKHFISNAAWRSGTWRSPPGTARCGTRGSRRSSSRPISRASRSIA